MTKKWELSWLKWLIYMDIKFYISFLFITILIHEWNDSKLSRGWKRLTVSLLLINSLFPRYKCSMRCDIQSLLLWLFLSHARWTMVWIYLSWYEEVFPIHKGVFSIFCSFMLISILYSATTSVSAALLQLLIKMWLPFDFKHNFMHDYPWYF